MVLVSKIDIDFLFVGKINRVSSIIIFVCNLFVISSDKTAKIKSVNLFYVLVIMKYKCRVGIYFIRLYIVIDRS